MELKQVTRKKGYTRFTRNSKPVRVNLSVQEFESAWMKKNNVSPTAILIAGLKEMGCKEESKDLDTKKVKE